jgi:hypothetical protein
VKRIIPIVIAMAVGLFVLLDIFIDNIYLNAIGQTFVGWAVILAAAALIVGLSNMVGVHFKRIRRRANGWPYSIALVLAMAVVAIPGLIDPAGPRNAIVSWLFNYVQYPLQAAIFALLAFFIFTAAYRAFRVRHAESLFFVLAGVFVLLGATPLGDALWSGFSEIRAWILAVPAMAGARGIILGVALATVVAGMRLLLGIDRPYAE